MASDSAPPSAAAPTDALVAPQRTGGAPVIRVLLKGGDDLRRSVLAPGGLVDMRLAEEVRQRSAGACVLDVRQEAGGTIRQVREELEGAARRGQTKDLGESRTAGGSFAAAVAGQWRPAVVVLSVAEDAQAGTDAESFLADLLALVSELKSELCAHVIIYNCSSVLPDDPAPGGGLSMNPTALGIHRLNRSALEASISEGISIVDVDRIAAELGAADHVLDLAVYSPTLAAATGSELVRIIADYGFFESRPLVSQVGRRERAGP